jgi:16S rRNA (uracil1498-N3)-methyltransferase
VPPRFFAPALPDVGETVSLPDDEAHHVRAVMRLRVGATVHIFDGRGRECRGRIDSVGRKAVCVRVEEDVAPAHERRASIALVQGVLRPDRMDDAVRDAVMMGVAAIVPLVCANVSVAAQSLKGERLTERWLRVALSSAKQCGRAVVPGVIHPVSFADWVAGSAGATRIALVEPSASTRADLDPARLRDAARRHGAELVVGPEGGWSEAELVALGGAGVDFWSLGGRTLRADAVPVAALAVLEYLWEREE